MDLHKDKASASPSDLRVSALESDRRLGMGELTAGALIETALFCRRTESGVVARRLPVRSPRPK